MNEKLYMTKKDFERECRYYQHKAEINAFCGDYENAQEWLNGLEWLKENTIIID